MQDPEKREGGQEENLILSLVILSQTQVLDKRHGNFSCGQYNLSNFVG